ncbi:MAG: protoporphyrinogen oxidase HemJ [Pseudomonadota bacterium]
MANYLSNYYEWFKALHVIFVICWMAGLFYLPRLYVYHTRVAAGSEADKIFQEMERKLLRIIMNPAMILALVFGSIDAHIYGFKALGVWFHIKMTAVLLLIVFHGFLARCRKDFILGQNKHSERFYRIINEVPALLMTVAVIMVIVKPFE